MENFCPCGYLNPIHLPLTYSESHACHAYLAAVTNNKQRTRLVNVISPIWQFDQQTSHTCVQLGLSGCVILLRPGEISLSNLALRTKEPLWLIGL